MINDLLWACPNCGSDAAFLRSRRRESCGNCGTLFRRGGGSTIESIATDGSTTVRKPAEWTALMPPLPLPWKTNLGQGASDSSGDRGEQLSSQPPPHIEARVIARFAIGERQVFRRGEFLGSIELLAPKMKGRLELTEDSLAFHGIDSALHRWPLEHITAVQPSSNTLQIKLRAERPVSFKFADQSPRLWENLLQETLRDYYAANAEGEIIEFQPRIVTR